MGGIFRLYREAYQGLPKQVWLISLIMLVNRSGTMVVPFMTIYLTSPEMGYSIGKAGYVLGAFGLGSILGGYLGGRITDRIGHYKVQFATLLGGGILFMVLGQVKSFELILLVTFLLSSINEAFRPANAASIASYADEGNRTRSFSLNRLAVNLGWAVGSALGGVLASIDFSVLFWVDGITNIAAALLLRYLLKPSSSVKKEKGFEKITAQSAYKDKIYVVFIFLTILFAICFFQMFSTLSAYMKNQLGFTSLFIGSLMAVNGLVITFIEMVLVYKLEGKRSPTFYIISGVFLVAIAYILLNIFSITHTMGLIIILLITFGEIFSMPFMNSFWTSRSNAGNRGQYAGLYTIAWSIAHTTGPLMGAQVADKYGFDTLWWSVGILGFMATAGFFLLHIKLEKKSIA
jgi:predicted MFS family arabinose efflux permease